MSAIPPISSSAYQAVQAGSASLDKAAAEFNSPNPWLVPEDSFTSPDSLQPTNPYLGNQINGPLDPLVAGVADLLKAKMQTSTGAALLRADAKHRQEIFDLLK